MNIMKPIKINKILYNIDKEKIENKTIDNIMNGIEEANKIIILTHESPDGDAIGSSLAMYFALKNYGKEAKVYIPEYSRLFEFLPGTDKILKELSDETFDLAIALDCADLNRLEGKESFENAKHTIVIDHHSVNSMYGDVNYVNPDAPACAQVLAAIFQYFNIEITKEIGTCLLTGIITDTGGFRYRGVTTETFEFAAELLRKGIDIPLIYNKVLETKTKGNYALTRIMMDRMEFIDDGKITFSYITKNDEKEVGAEIGDDEGLVEIGRDIEGVLVSILVKEKEKNVYKISLRSVDEVNVSDICYIFGGGGHINAAGCKIQGTFDEVKKKIINQVKESLLAYK